ncbi:hypothetical protein K493DRAFT_295672 [Basidiobolus meristosporus CBS 931.73]|uniref:Uncharacterized protein n=1 Tax=Basidiobolus meristosporus CBS 931.73 TaxID=1314790 RepID=A0A1Y1Z9Z1_9FUNG|nr:hypothetical protein K493DRAFT_295672 [Basidiobolus meristosporus CBS 931.73]|eukprot:ORY07098.1 hypothetical protein K493DRAFT_295672 [Basidiobolus meristosporus CBS 931.73]
MDLLAVFKYCCGSEETQAYPEGFNPGRRPSALPLLQEMPFSEYEGCPEPNKLNLSRRPSALPLLDPTPNIPKKCLSIGKSALSEKLFLHPGNFKRDSLLDYGGDLTKVKDLLRTVSFDEAVSVGFDVTDKQSKVTTVKFTLTPELARE